MFGGCISLENGQWIRVYEGPSTFERSGQKAYCVMAMQASSIVLHP